MKKQAINTFSNSQLASALNRLGIEFLLLDLIQDEEMQVSPEELITGLSCSSEARLRLALIPLFLQHSRLASLMPTVIKKLPRNAQVTLQCYYCAAFYLQQKYARRLENLFGEQDALPPLFLEQIGLSLDGDTDANLRALAREQQIISGRLINWYGTYEHAAQRLLVHQERAAA